MRSIIASGGAVARLAQDLDVVRADERAAELA